MPAELDLQDLCAGAAESEEPDGVWTSLFIFIALFLLSVTYSASVTLCKVGRRRAGRSSSQGQPRSRGASCASFRRYSGSRPPSCDRSPRPPTTTPTSWSRQPGPGAPAAQASRPRAPRLRAAKAAWSTLGGSGAQAKPQMGQSQGPNRQLTGIQKVPARPQRQGDRQSCPTSPHSGSSHKSICPFYTEAWAGRGRWHSGFLQAPGVEATLILTEHP